MRVIIKYIFVYFIWIFSLGRRLWRNRRQVVLPAGRCLIISLSGIGNAVLCIPLIHALKAKAGADIVDVLASSSAHKAIFQGIDFTNTTFLYPKNWLRRWRLLKLLRKQKYDLLFFAFPTLAINQTLLPLIINPGLAITHNYVFFHPIFKYLKYISDRVVQIDTNNHDVEQNLNLLQHLISSPVTFECYPAFHVSVLSRQETDNYLAKHNLKKGDMLCFIHPGCRRGADYKRWPVDNFIELGKTLAHNHSAKIVVLIGPDELEYRKYFIDSGFCIVESVNFEMILTLLQRASMLISNDSGLMHAAALLRVPTITIWGGTDVRRNGARGNIAVNIVNDKIQCRPCVRFLPDISCPDTKFECIQSITVENVYQIILNSGLLKN